MDEERFELRALLAWASAPPEVLAWARAHEALAVSLEDADDAMALLERTSTPEAAVWLAAVLTIPLDLIAGAVIVAIEAEAAPLDDALIGQACALAIESIAGSEDGAALLAMAERCEARLSADTASYRGRDPRERATAAAAAAACRAAEALGAAKVRIAFELDAAAATRASLFGGSLVGATPKAILGDREPPFALARPALGDKPVPHDLRAGVGLLADALTYLGETDTKRVRDLFLDALVEE